MCEWLAHPREYGRPPDSIEKVDTRELYWPPTRDRRQLWIFRYRYFDEDGDVMDDCYGLVGSITWSMLDFTEASADDVYALHCASELRDKQDPQAPPKVEASAGRKILKRYNPEFGRPSLRVLGDSGATE